MKLIHKSVLVTTHFEIWDDFGEFLRQGHEVCGQERLLSSTLRFS